MTRKKPEKPYKDFPLFPHANGQWAKKIRGRLRYFGAWADWESALDDYLKQKDELQAGREPQDPGIKLRELCELFLVAKMAMVETKELSIRTWQSYKATVDNLLKHFSREMPVRSFTPTDFARLKAEIAKKRLAAVALGNEIQRVRTIFKYGFDAGHIAEPVRFGPDFRKPSRKVVRAARHAAGKRLFTVEEVRAICYGTKRQLKAISLLGINCGFGQSDISNLPLTAIEGDWIEYPRPKTAVHRRCPLWPETKTAIQDYLRHRPTPKPGFEHLAFLTRHGRPWVRTIPQGTPDDKLGQAFAKLLRTLGVKRPKISFYALRHTFETISGEAKDQVATDSIMGHVDPSMAANYRHHISDERLRDAVAVVHRWLFPKPWVGSTSWPVWKEDYPEPLD